MYKIIAVDDEIYSLKRFENIIKEEKRVELVDSFTDPFAALEFIKNNPIDIAFLDIEMPGLNGLELAERIQEADPYVSIVFVTAFDQYSLDAFKAHAIGYLLKPLDIEEFSSQINILDRTRAPRVNQDAAKDESEDKATLIVNCLGSFNCYLKGKEDETVTFRTTKTAELFALLIHHYESPATKYFILDSLFPDMDYEKSNKLFYVSCSYLRSAFSKLGITGILVRENDNYRLNFSNIECDYVNFIKYSQRINDMSIEELNKASILYKGEYLKGYAYEWAIESKPYVDTLYERIQLRIVDLYLDSDNTLDAITLLEKYQAQDPLREEVVYRLMQLYISQNKTSMAKTLYKTYSDKLYKQLDSEPSDKLKNLLK